MKEDKEEQIDRLEKEIGKLKKEKDDVSRRARGL